MQLLHQHHRNYHHRIQLRKTFQWQGGFGEASNSQLSYWRARRQSRDALISTSSSFFIFGFFNVGLSLSVEWETGNGKRKRQEGLFSTRDAVQKAWFHLDLFPLLCECRMMSDFHTWEKRLKWSRDISTAGDWLCLEFKTPAVPRMHRFFFNAPRMLLTWKERKSEGFTARMLVHGLTFEKHCNTCLQMLRFII